MVTTHWKIQKVRGIYTVYREGRALYAHESEAEANRFVGYYTKQPSETFQGEYRYNRTTGMYARIPATKVVLDEIEPKPTIPDAYGAW